MSTDLTIWRKIKADCLQSGDLVAADTISGVETFGVIEALDFHPKGVVACSFKPGENRVCQLAVFEMDETLYVKR
jgi:hypothetical protein